MKSHYLTISALGLLTLATAAFGTLGYFQKLNPSIHITSGTVPPPERGYAIYAVNGDLTIAFEAYRRTPY